MAVLYMLSWSAYLGFRCRSVGTGAGWTRLPRPTPEPRWAGLSNFEGAGQVRKDSTKKRERKEGWAVFSGVWFSPCGGETPQKFVFKVESWSVVFFFPSCFASFFASNRFHDFSRELLATWANVLFLNVTARDFLTYLLKKNNRVVDTKSLYWLFFS